MAWTVLVISGLLETAWAIALDRSAGFSKPLPTAIFGVALVLSMLGLGYALRTIPVGTGYAVWVGIGAVGVAIAGIVVFGEAVSAVRLLFLSIVVVGIVGLRLVEG
jgi:quaternary ammonium compound-resistance protein SugE